MICKYWLVVLAAAACAVCLVAVSCTELDNPYDKNGGSHNPNLCTNSDTAYTLVVGVGSGGGGTAGILNGSHEGKYICGTKVGLTAVAEVGYAFAGWSSDGVLISENCIDTITVTRGLELTAAFEPFAGGGIMVPIQGGTFTMGCTTPGSCSETNKCIEDNSPHQDFVNDFYIGRYEVTQGLWMFVMNGISYSEYSLMKDNVPKGNITFNDIKEFILRLNNMTGREYRLPTEKEWEYAARGGEENLLYSGSDDHGNVACTNGTQPCLAGSKNKNDFGLYDMSGNLFELVIRENAAEQYNVVFRGGAYNVDPSYSYVYACRVFDSNTGDPARGFRLAHPPVSDKGAEQ